MRAIRPAVLSLAIALAINPVAAEPKAAPGYQLKTVSKPGAIFAGLAREGDDLLVTNLGDGRLYRLGQNGAFAAFGPAFPNGLDVIGDPTGPYRIAPFGDGYLIAQGWTPADATEGPYDHALLSLDNAGVLRVVDKDFWNPFDFAIDRDTVYVVDAARNAVERLRPDGERTTIATFQRLQQGEAALKDLSPTEFSEAGNEVDAVPTGIALRDGRLSVALFGGFPFVAGTGQVVSFPADGDSALQVDVSGLNAPVDLEWKDGSLLILEHGTFDQATGFEPGTGRLIAFDDMHGGREMLLEGLTRPASVLVWDDQQIVVSELGGSIHFLKPKPAN